MWHQWRLIHVSRCISAAGIDAFVTVSGDGLFHEVIQGLMSRDDWATAIKTPVGIIPAGSGNGLAVSIGSQSPLKAALAVIKGRTEPLDLLSVAMGDRKPYYAHLEIVWGLISDVDIESDRLCRSYWHDINEDELTMPLRYRWAGPARFTLSAVGRTLNPRKYRGKLAFLAWTEV